ncbi:hypothetical protein Aperf_G00000059424 [Anoplocephala perfoliata]
MQAFNPASTTLSSKDLNNLTRADASKFFSVIDFPSHPNCRSFRQAFPMMTKPDGDMDIAFTLVVHKDIGQVARLLRMIHRVNNYYCVHLDSRSPRYFQEALAGLAACFGSNVEIVPPEKRVEVNWGDESVLRPQFICAEQALKRHSTWKYLINIVGQEFPLRTNLELQAALKALTGSNLIECFAIDKYRSWTRNIPLPFKRQSSSICVSAKIAQSRNTEFNEALAKEVEIKENSKRSVHSNAEMNQHAKWYKGYVYGAFGREFLQETVMSASTQPFRKLLLQPEKFAHPDELYFVSLNCNPHLKLPGSCLVAPSPQNERSPHLFANKFHADYHPEAYNQMEEWYFDKLRREIATGSYSKDEFDVTAYANRTCSRLHI